MVILGIETSCDETSCCLVKDGVQIISEVTASSLNIHKDSGGIIPENAARKQVEYITGVISKCLTESDIDILEIDAIAVTVGPGLIGSLLVGTETARTLSYLWNKKIIPVNHLVGHVYANFISKDNNLSSHSPDFPLLSLIASGGHTDLVLFKNHDDFIWIGGTRDDASGEAFDKCARILGLDYPGGPSISKQASIYFSNAPKDVNLQMFPRPLINQRGFDWSFSGLKTAVYKEVNSCSKDKLKEMIPEYSAQIQEAIVDCLIERCDSAIERYNPSSFALSGGVGANDRLRKCFIDLFDSKYKNINLFLPKKEHCTDNASMIASAGYFHPTYIDWKDVGPNPQLSIKRQS